MEYTAVAELELEEEQFTPISEDEMVRAVMTHRAKMINYAAFHYKISVSEAEDLVGEVSFKALRNRELYNPAKGAITTFLYRVMNNLNIDNFRSGKNKMNRNMLSNETVADDGGTYRYDGEVEQVDLAATEDGDILLKSVDLLPGKLGICLRYVADGMPYEEISELVGAPVGTVKAWVNRARRIMVETMTSTGLLDKDKLGRSAYMLERSGQGFAKESQVQHTLATARVARTSLLGIEKKNHYSPKDRYVPMEHFTNLKEQAQSRLQELNLQILEIDKTRDVIIKERDMLRDTIDYMGSLSGRPALKPINTSRVTVKPSAPRGVGVTKNRMADLLTELGKFTSGPFRLGELATSLFKSSALWGDAARQNQMSAMTALRSLMAEVVESGKVSRNQLSQRDVSYTVVSL